MFLQKCVSRFEAAVGQALVEERRREQMQLTGGGAGSGGAGSRGGLAGVAADGVDGVGVPPVRGHETSSSGQTSGPAGAGAAAGSGAASGAAGGAAAGASLPMGALFGGVRNEGPESFETSDTSLGVTRDQVF
jgi:hypothetical protein